MTGGYVFTLSTTRGGTPSPSHNTSTGPVSFPGCTPSPSHDTSTGPMSFLGGTQWLTPGSFLDVIQVQVRMGYPPWLGRGTPSWPGRNGIPSDWDGVLLPDRLCLDRLCHRRYASRGFTQEGFLVVFQFSFPTKLKILPTQLFTSTLRRIRAGPIMELSLWRKQHLLLE